MPVKRRDPPRIELVRLIVRLNSLQEAADEAQDELQKKYAEDVGGYNVAARKRVLASMVPTFLYMQVDTLFEDFINLLWKTRYPELERTRPHFEEKLKILGDLHEFDPAKFKRFHTIRNDAAHQPWRYLTFDQFEEYHSALYVLVGRMYRRAYQRKRKPKPRTQTSA